MKKYCSFVLAMILSSTALVAQKMPNASVTPAIHIIQIEPTALFPKPADGQPLKRLIRILYVNAGYDHAMFQDTIVKQGTVYYYKVRTVDASGQKGTCSQEVSIRTK